MGMLCLMLVYTRLLSLPAIQIEDKRTSYTKLLSAETNGVNIANHDHDTVVTDCLHHIYGDSMPNVGIYKAILATGYTDVVLDKPLTKHDIRACLPVRKLNFRHGGISRRSLRLSAIMPELPQVRSTSATKARKICSV